jgi:hypothetical protein
MENVEEGFSIFHFPFIICHFSLFGSLPPDSRHPDPGSGNGKWKMTNGEWKILPQHIPFV